MEAERPPISTEVWLPRHYRLPNLTWTPHKLTHEGHRRVVRAPQTATPSYSQRLHREDFYKLGRHLGMKGSMKQEPAILG